MPNIALELGKQSATFGVHSAYGEQQDVDGMRLGRGAVIPVPSLPHAHETSGVRDEDLLPRDAHAAIQPVPSRVQRVEGDQLHATGERPARDEESRQRRLAGPAAAVDEDHRVRRCNRPDGGDERLRCRIERSCDRVGVTS